ncbi:unnamed protein product [Blepharisma stoltei]|uniref:Zinc finger PHD-type domain-containing protein n=1 Tax=Blepharisma stoltei TaxID=1481888 RepID=A0AAU9K1W9_9CILI|nr:unnamed protein product [Blepharisma stoltei]
MCEIPSEHSPHTHPFGISSSYSTYYSSDSYGEFQFPTSHTQFIDQVTEPVSLEFKSESTSCDACMDSNPILLLECTLCKVRVHSSCYGLFEYIDPWVCERCLWKVVGKNIFPCKICNISKGALKKMTNGDWVHVGCVDWCKSLKFNNHKKSEYIRIKDQESNKCIFCNQNSDSLIKCEDCEDWFHFKCGQLNGVNFIDNRASCKKHSKKDSEEKKGEKGKGKEEGIKYNIVENLEEDTLIVDVVIPNKKQKKKLTKKSTEKKSKDKKIKITESNDGVLTLHINSEDVEEKNEPKTKFKNELKIEEKNEVRKQKTQSEGPLMVDDKTVKAAARRPLSLIKNREAEFRNPFDAVSFNLESEKSISIIEPDSIKEVPAIPPSKVKYVEQNISRFLKTNENEKQNYEEDEIQNKNDYEFEMDIAKEEDFEYEVDWKVEEGTEIAQYHNLIQEKLKKEDNSMDLDMSDVLVYESKAAEGKKFKGRKENTSKEYTQYKKLKKHKKVAKETKKKSAKNSEKPKTLLVSELKIEETNTAQSTSQRSSQPQELISNEILSFKEPIKTYDPLNIQGNLQELETKLKSFLRINAAITFNSYSFSNNPELQKIFQTSEILYEQIRSFVIENTEKV